MFLNSLPQSQKVAFLALVRDFVRVDEKVSETEIQSLEVMCHGMGLDPKMWIEKRPRAEWFKQIEGRPARVAVLFELLGLAFADHDFGALERAFIQEACAEWGFSEEDLKEFANWVERHMALVAEAQRLMNKMHT